MDDELHETMERLRDSIGNPPERMTERLSAHVINALTSQQGVGTVDGEGSTAPPAKQQ